MKTMAQCILLAATLLLAPFAQAAATLTVLHSFSGGLADDSVEEGLGVNGLVLGTDGNFYGAANGGGSGAVYNDGCGTIFRMAHNGEFRVLHTFTGLDGKSPGGFAGLGDSGDVGPGLVQGADGNFYGFTIAGGMGFNPGGVQNPCYNQSDSGYGTLFRIATSHGGPRTDFPSGGWDHVGTLFRMTPQGKLTTLLFFNFRNGLYPRGSPVQAGDGRFYGTTWASDTNNGYGPGEIFRLTVPGAEAPKIISTVNSETAVTLNWLTLRGRSYQLQFTTDLTQTNWTNAGGPITATNTSATASDLLGPERQRFYRVVLMP